MLALFQHFREGFDHVFLFVFAKLRCDSLLFSLLVLWWHMWLMAFRIRVINLHPKTTYPMNYEGVHFFNNAVRGDGVKTIHAGFSGLRTSDSVFDDC